MNLSIDQTIYVAAGVVRGVHGEEYGLYQAGGGKWVDELEFGVAFGSLDERAADDLQQLLGELLDSESYSKVPVHL